MKKEPFDLRDEDVEDQRPADPNSEAYRKYIDFLDRYAKAIRLNHAKNGRYVSRHAAMNEAMDLGRPIPPDIPYHREKSIPPDLGSLRDHRFDDYILQNDWPMNPRSPYGRY